MPWSSIYCCWRGATFSVSARPATRVSPPQIKGFSLDFMILLKAGTPVNITLSAGSGYVYRGIFRTMRSRPRKIYCYYIIFALHKQGHFLTVPLDLQPIINPIFNGVMG